MTTGVSAIRAKLRGREWPVASAPAGMLAYLFLVEAVAAAFAGVALAQLQPTAHDARLAVYFTVMAVAFEEGVRRAARLEMRLSADLKRDMTSVWTVATAVVLPAGYAVLVIAVLVTYVWIRQHRPAGRPLYRGVFNVCLLVLSAQLANLTVHHWSSAWAELPWALSGACSVFVAMVAYTTANRLLASIALVLVGVPLRELRGTRDDNLIEFATLCLGGLVAITALYEPALCVLVLAPMVTLQRGALVRELETAASVDAKTGLLNAVAWEFLAQRELARAAREDYDVAVLIVDVDRFKLVNDEYGHLAGDKVLHGIGRLLAAEVREYDTVGRFGGEEFVAVLPKAGDVDALIIAERLRSRVNDLRIGALLDGDTPPGVIDRALAVSIGVACSRHDGTDVSDLLVAADAALYRAKSGGRNRVVLADRGVGGASHSVVNG